MKPSIFIKHLFLPAILITGFYIGGYFSYLVPFICFILHPLFNLLVNTNPSNENEDEITEGHLYRIIALMYVPVLVSLTIWALFQFAFNNKNLFELIGLALSIGIVNGTLSFTLAHEFIHRHNKIEKGSGYLLLLMNNYMHYGIEHVWGHHVYACTKQDPHTALKGESSYHFLFRAMKNTFLNAWNIEIKRNQRKTRCNTIMFFVFIQLCFCLLIFFVFGWKAFLLFALENFVAVGLLHTVNYLQHYGLMREEKQNGQFEKIASRHAWSSGKRMNGLSLFQLDKHADHHMHPTHTYETLKDLQGSPEHPTGYSGMIMLALLPPLWFKIMDKRIPTTQNIKHETV